MRKLNAAMCNFSAMFAAHIMCQIAQIHAACLFLGISTCAGTGMKIFGQISCLIFYTAPIFRHSYVDGGISMNIFGYVSKSRQQRNPRDTTGYGFNPIIC